MASTEPAFHQTNALAGATAREISDLARLRQTIGLTLILIELVGLLGLN